jgi:hypothetical protein
LEEEEELAPSEMELMYTQRMRTISVRCRILRNELTDRGLHWSNVLLTVSTFHATGGAFRVV